MSDDPRRWTVAELLRVLGGESDLDAGLALEAWQVALAIGLTDLLPGALARRAQTLIEQGLLDPPPAERPALRLGPIESAMLEQVRRRYAYVPGRRR